MKNNLSFCLLEALQSESKLGFETMYKESVELYAIAVFLNLICALQMQTESKEEEIMKVRKRKRRW